MKRIISILLLCTCCIGELLAQKSDAVNLKNVSIEKVAGDVQVRFTAEIGRKAVRNNYKLTLTPILYKEKDSLRLAPIVVYTRNARIVEERGVRSRVVGQTDEYCVTNHAVVSYAVTVPYQEWMNGGNLYLQKVIAGCCTERYTSPLLLAENLVLVAPAPEPVVAEPEPRQFKWSFSKEDMVIDFIVSKAEINFNLFENREILAEIVEAVKKVQSTRGASLDKIEITGYASPEGRRDFNLQLGQNRAVALRDYLKIQIPELKDKDFDLINGEENWKGLRSMVAASDMKDKDAILYIIDHVPVEVDLVKNTSRKKQLMEFKQGVPYRYMLKTFYPRLRNACYIGVYYINKVFIN